MLKALILSGLVLVAPPALAQTAVAAVAARAAPAVTVVAAEERRIAEIVTVTGNLAAREEVAVGVDIAGMRIMELRAEVGDVVDEGDILAVLDPATLEVAMAQAESQAAKAEAGVAQAKAMIAEAEAARADAQDAARRAKELRRRGVASVEQADSARNALARAEARVVSAQQGLGVAEADLRLAEARRDEVALNLSKTDIRAPRAGLILSRAAQIGAIASPAAPPLFRIARDGAIELRAEATEIDLARIGVGMKAAVEVVGLNEAIPGAVRLISPEVDARSRMGAVRIALPADERLRSGAFARAEITRAEAVAVTIPASAVTMRGDAARAQVVADGVVETRLIEIGLRDDKGVAVREGVAAGETVVLRAGAFLQDGDRVTPAPVAEGGE